MKKLDYKKSGVDIANMDEFKNSIKSVLRRSFTPFVLKDIGGFGSLFEFDKNRFKKPVLVSSADGVGTKLKIASLADKHDEVGIDLVAMNVNDILCVGARPLFFLDYISFSSLDKFTLENIIVGINKGCIDSGCSLIGGETAQMPGMYDRGEYDLAGFCVGVAEKDHIIDGSRIKNGDLILGLESSGLHSNGFSLVRKVFSQNELLRLKKELLIPTKIYVKGVLDVLYGASYKLDSDVHGISHITGGAFYDKIKRILPETLDALINKSSWKPQKIFQLIQNKGNIKDHDMYHTFNMGIGMVLICDNKASDKIIRRLKDHKIHAATIGKIIKGARKVIVQ